MKADRPSNLAIVEACSLLRPLPDHLRRQLAAAAIPAAAKRGQVIWNCGERGGWWGIVGSGFLRLCKCSPKGVETTVQLFGPGQVFGLIVAMEDKPYPLTAIASTALEYLKVPADVFRPMYDCNPELKDHILSTVSARLQQAHEQMLRFLSSRVEGRIAAVLLTLAEEHGEPFGRGIRIRPPLTRQDIGEMAGTTTETTIRVMSPWQKAGWVATRERHVIIMDPERIASLLER